MKKVYIVTVQHANYIWEKVSQEGYDSLIKAQKFIESRSDKPEKFTDFNYKSDSNIYRIYEISVV